MPLSTAHRHLAQPKPGLDPVPNRSIRRDLSRRLRNEAATIAYARVDAIEQRNNGETHKHAKLATFTKGLPHDEHGHVRHEDLDSLVDALNQASDNDPAESPFPGTYASGLPAPFAANLYKDGFTWPTQTEGARTWESPLAGHTFEINGPDADQVSMPPAPRVGSDELTAEMAEVYEMALLRDVAFRDWPTDPAVGESVARLKQLACFRSDTVDPNARATRRRRARVLSGEDLTEQTLFRGSTPGAQKGGYISQFMLVGSKERRSAEMKAADVGNDVKPDAINRAARFGGKEAAELYNPGAKDEVDHATGLIQYGAQTINQRIVPHEAGLDHMTDWTSWLEVQNGANRKGFDDYEEHARFVHTPRDLATYVHFDALYQAYLNACLVMIAEGADFDIGLPEGVGHKTRDAFATFGGPHILTLVTEVATRALKAVRRQKYNIHLRARPEAVAAALTLAWNKKPEAADFGLMTKALGQTGLLERICAHNTAQNGDYRDGRRAGGVDGEPGFPSHVDQRRNGLLPMAFPEGSPMHPSYGAGHATVAGACTTVLKAFFEMFDTGADDAAIERGSVPLKNIVEEGAGGVSRWFGAERPMVGKPGLGLTNEYRTSADGKALEPVPEPVGLTIQGELDKLAANVSIGRDFAGVHYYTDYYESLRMGERVAVGMLQEQMLTYREPVMMRFTSFDGDRIMLTGTGGSRHGPGDPKDAVIHVWDADGAKVDAMEWWNRALIEDAEGTATV